MVIQAVADSGSLYFNYKKTFSIVLLAMVDAEYNFIYVDVGCQGRISDGGVFRNSTLCESLENNKLHIPPCKELPGSETATPYVVVADDAFSLKHYLMKPYTGRYLKHEEVIFNYRLSRARRVVENAFGILASRFRAFRKPFLQDVATVKSIVLASVCLHNFLRSRPGDKIMYMPPGTIDHENLDLYILTLGSWRQEPAATGLIPLHKQGSHNPSFLASNIRQEYLEYFNGIGKVSWQDKFVT